VSGRIKGLFRCLAGSLQQTAFRKYTENLGAARLSDATLVIPEREIRRHGPGRLLAICWRQWRTERALAHRGIRFRHTDPEKVASAYLAMTPAEFDAINGPQDWANWRTIPRSLSSHITDRPLRVIDLGCGSGGSTRVLAFYCPTGSHITGYEFAAPLLAVARRREYVDKAGRAAQVDFVCQGVTEILRGADGLPLSDQSVNLVNSSGVIGHHLTVQTIDPLVAELLRVLRPGGTAMLDVGPTLSAKELTAILEPAGFALLGHYRSWFGDVTGEMVFRLNAGSPG
jgi:SAM-dependent methyltransferase